MISLKGMTWDHTRGYDPMVATAAVYQQRHPDVQITWEKRSLQAFADFPLRELAAQYDLIVIDHPHVGAAVEDRCLVALDAVGREADLATLARQSLGVSHASYQIAGHQWAVAIDAATQVASYRPDLIDNPPTTWDEVIALARQGQVLWPIKPVDALMSFFTLAANRGTPCRTDGGQLLIEVADALAVLERLLELARLVPRDCLSMNPIETYEQMVRQDRFAYCPLGYGYTNYSRPGHRPKMLQFTNIPTVGNGGPRGSAIGGTGLAVSSSCREQAIAVDYALWVASADVQRGIYFDAGGQPGNAIAWDDDRCNRLASNFFRATRKTLDAVYLRPRYPGYLNFQDRGGTIVNAFLAGEHDAHQTVDLLHAAYRESLT